MTEFQSPSALARKRLQRARYLASFVRYDHSTFSREDFAQELVLDCLEYEQKTGKKAQMGKFVVSRVMGRMWDTGYVVRRPEWVMRSLLSEVSDRYAFGDIMTPQALVET